MSSLFLAPHNDDEVLFGTFTLLREQPHVVICLRSFRMADPNYPGGMPIDYRTRELETEFAMKTLGCTWEQMHHPDSGAQWDAVFTSLRDVRDQGGEWNHVYAPAVEENGHEQHNMVGEIAASVFRDVPITYYLTYTPAGKSQNANEVDFEPEWIAKKLHAMAIYKSQAAHPATRKHFIDHSIREFYA